MGIIIGIVGSEASKFTPIKEIEIKSFLAGLISSSGIDGVASGECHLGGIDIWAKEECLRQGKVYKGFPPEVLQWDPPGKIGYMQRNIQIADASDEVVCLTVRELPATYVGMKFDFCYHCKTNAHVKSGGCWTVKYAISKGKIGNVVSF